MKLIFGDYLLTTGWGGHGIYDVDQAIGIEGKFTDKLGITYDHKRHIIPPAAVICGDGSGYEEILFNAEICEKLKELFNEHNKGTSKG